MIAVSAFNLAVANLIAGDTAWLANATANHLHLVNAPFTPAPTLSLTDLSLGDSDFTGSSPKTIPFGAQTVVRDGGNGAWGIYLKEPLGGLRWVCTAAPVSAITYYGVALSDGTDTTLIGCRNFDDGAKVIQFVGDFIEISAEFGFLPASLMLPLTPTP